MSIAIDKGTILKIDPEGKYIILISPRPCEEEIEKLRARLTAWLLRANDPIAIVWGEGLTLVDAATIQEVRSE